MSLSMHLSECAGHCSQVNQLLELESEQSMNTQKYTALDNWAKHLGATHQAILNKMA